MTTLNVILNGARGGQGTSTIAAALALYAAGHVDTHLVARDPAASAALLGIVTPQGGEPAVVTDRLTLVGTAIGTPALRILDSPVEDSDPAERTVRLTVLRGPCYLALRTIVVEPTSRPDGIVLVAEPGRSLTSRDVADVTGTPVVATVPVDPSVARTIDAGLLVARLHRLSALAPLRRSLATLLDANRPQAPPSGLQPPVATPAVDLNEQRPERVDKTGTDLPLPLCGRGRGSSGRRVAVCHRAYPTRDRRTSGRDHAQHRQAQCGRRRVLRR